MSAHMPQLSISSELVEKMLNRRFKKYPDKKFVYVLLFAANIIIAVPF